MPRHSGYPFLGIGPNLSQKQLAEKSGTKQSVVSRIEDDNYDGHSLKLLHKIAWALNLKLIVKFVEKQATIYYCNPIILDTANYTLPVPPVITGTTFSLGTLPINRIGGYQLVSGSNSQRVVRERS
jgi:transcriptional regulator with XRE-family HTH domain